MAHNFRYTNPNLQLIYVSKDGNDSNTGLDPNAPKKTFSGALSQASSMMTANSQVRFGIVIGAGTYSDSINVVIRGNLNSIIIAEGQVVFRGTGTNVFQIGITTSSLLNISGLTLENYATVTFRHPITDCTFKNCGTVQFGIQAGAAQSFRSCRFFDCTTVELAQNEASNCDFVNCSNILNASTFYNNYCNGTTNVTAVASPANFNYNNLMGNIKVGAGTFQTLTDHKISNPSLNQNSINTSPKFNGAAKYDLSLQYDSPHIGAGVGGVNIGSGSYAIAYQSAVADCWKATKGAMYSGVELAGTDIVLSSGVTTGYVISAPIKVFANPTVINKLSYIGFTLFNKDIAGGTATNINVPDSYVTPKGDSSGGSNPDRLSIQMRYTDNEVQPGSEPDWLNGYLTNPGVFINFEINNKPLVDNAGYGNGHPLFNNAVAYEVSAVWVQFKVVLTNAYV